MNAPVLWIVLPILFSGFTLTLGSRRTMAIAGGLAALVLAGIALVLPIDEALRLGPFSLKIAASASFLGRSLVLPAAEAPLLAVIFGLCTLWFFAADAAGVADRLVPFGLTITALLVASIAVQPFLFASIFIEIAILVAVPLLSPVDQRPGTGVIRFLIYETLGMPFILLAGWLLAGVEASPGDLSLTVQATVMLGVGFAFLFAVFPLSIWIPQLMKQCEPFAAGFLLWLLPTMVVVFAMGFLDRYAWLRTSPDVIAGLRVMGILMLVTGAAWAAFQEHLGTIMAYSSIAEIGFMLLALSLAASGSQNLIFLLLIPRGVALAVWSLGLSVMSAGGKSLDFDSLKGAVREHPWAAAGVALAGLSAAGFPLLAGFPSRLALWQGIGQDSTAYVFWFLIGLLGLTIAAIRQITALIRSSEESPWKSQESIVQRSLLGAGMVALFVLGIFPRTLAFLSDKLPLMFQHLSR